MEFRDISRVSKVITAKWFYSLSLYTGRNRTRRCTARK